MIIPEDLGLLLGAGKVPKTIRSGRPDLSEAYYPMV